MTEEEQLLRAKLRIRKRRIVVNILRVVLGIVIVGSWQLTTATGFVDKFNFGQPTGIVTQLQKWITDGTAQGPLWKQVVVTLEETLLGFGLGMVLGVVAGVLLGTNRLLADILAPYIKALNAIPRVVLGAIFTIALGLGMTSKVALALVLVFFVVFFNAYQGVREVDPNLLANARLLGADRRRVIQGVIVPSAMSWILASLHTAFGFALIGAVVGEFLGSTEGIGLLISSSQNTFNANGVFAAMVLLAVVALTAEACVTAAENRLVRWRPNQSVDVHI
ncbi:MAG TPA: ABC transporter permease [Candidatus Dormibacteraeota bacterium]|nr:ABC transporter permease [Candidatus Dormibacteraeota bacterium]